ncbi:hypothetical protein RYX36_014927 [Vicia faba]
MYIDKIFYPQTGFDREVIHTLLKPKGNKRKHDALHDKKEGTSSFDCEGVSWGILLLMKKDQHKFFRFVRDQHAWNKKMYSLHKGGVMNIPPIFLKHVLGDHQGNHCESSGKSKENMENMEKKKAIVKENANKYYQVEVVEEHKVMEKRQAEEDEQGKEDEEAEETKTEKATAKYSDESRTISESNDNVEGKEL